MATPSCDSCKGQPFHPHHGLRYGLARPIRRPVTEASLTIPAPTVRIAGCRDAAGEVVSR